MRSVMYEAMMEPYIGIRDLSAQIGIDVLRLSAMRLDECGDASEDEVAKLEAILKVDLKYMLDSDYKKTASTKRAETEGHLNEMRSARKAIIATGKRAGSFTCPRCNGVLRFEVHYNGHVWAKCDTPDCLNWIE